MNHATNYEFERDAICPYCGWEHRDCWEWHDGEDGFINRHECDRCGELFTFEVHVSIKYSTYPIIAEDEDLQ